MSFNSYISALAMMLLLLPGLAQAATEVLTEKFDNGVVSNEYFYQDGQLIENRYYDNTGRLSGLRRFSYPETNHVVITAHSVGKEDQYRILSKEEWSNLGPKNKQLPTSVRLKSWSFSDKAPYTIEFIAHHESQKPYRIIQKDYVNASNLLTSSLVFSYEAGQERPFQFVETSPQGNVISKYALYEKYSVTDSLRAAGKGSAEIEILRKNRENPNKFLVAIIDSGFDYNHVDLVTKWWNNPLDPVDGVDNDGNGWVDDNFGWDQVGDRGLPSETTSAFNKDARPLSHGTHVAHIATKNLDNVGLIGFAGDYTNPAYIEKVSAFLKKHQVRVVNMSLGLPHDFKDMMGLKVSIRAYQKMIDENPETLFVVASGNAAQDIDISKNRQYPASFTQANVLKVGALTAATLEEVTPQNAKMADYSNYGLQNVDILAPGTKVMAASLGGGLIAHSGTSMATPYMVNQVAQLWSELPHLKASEIRELFIETATPLTPVAPIKSGGYVNLKGALIKAKMKFLSGKYSQSNGPNCWNAATYVAGISKGLHYTSDAEFAFLLQSPLCQQVPEDQLQAGDILALRRFDQKGRLLPASFLSEVHGFTFAEKEDGFSKNGENAQAAYQFQGIADVFKTYRSTEFSNCKKLGLDRAQCLLRQQAFRCTDLRTYSKNNLNTFEKNLLMKVEKLEKAIEQQQFHKKVLNFDKDKVQKELELEVEKLRAQGSAELVTDYLDMRLHSLSLVFR